VNADGSTESGSLIDEIVREGARRMLAAALEAEVNQYIAELAAATDEAGRRLVVRNGYHRSRTVTTAAGPIEVTAPRVNDKRVDAATGERMRFSSKILPPWCRKSPKVSEVLPLLYLHGLSSGDFVPAMEQFLGSTAGLSPATVTRLTKQWSEDHAAFQQRDLAESDYVYVWADGVHPKVRLGQAHSCVLVLMGVRLDGTKELIALAEGLREFTESWADLLRDCRRRGMRDPELVVGDGAMGLWKALAEVFPAARHQRCWVHRSRKESTCCFVISGSLAWYGDHGGDTVPTRLPVRGVAAASERAAAASGGGGRGEAARTRRRAGRRPGGIRERDHCAPGDHGTGSRRRNAARRTDPCRGRGSQIGRRDRHRPAGRADGTGRARRAW
jgi:hypothetical protein